MDCHTLVLTKMTDLDTSGQVWMAYKFIEREQIERYLGDRIPARWLGNGFLHIGQPYLLAELYYIKFLLTSFGTNKLQTPKCIMNQLSSVKARSLRIPFSNASG